MQSQHCKRATPTHWVKFLTSSKIVKTLRNKQPPFLFQYGNVNQLSWTKKIRHWLFSNDSKWRPGKQIMRYWLEIMKNLQPRWAFNKKNFNSRMPECKSFKSKTSLRLVIRVYHRPLQLQHLILCVHCLIAFPCSVAWSPIVFYLTIIVK